MFRRQLGSSPLTSAVSLLAAFLPLSSAERIIESKSLNPCLDNSGFSATLFNVAFTPDNNTLSFNINGVSAISGNVTAQLSVIAYGYNAITQNLNPCENADLKGLCPMNTGQINLQSNVPIPASTIKQIPNIAFTIPDLDGKVQVYINRTDTREVLACVEADLSNGQTVNQKAIGWVTAIIAGMGLLASAITSGLGNQNTAAHVASNALSLFGFFQAQAFIGMTAVELPPVAASWTQNFQWSMGIIRVGFLQQLATWYQRATGGTPTHLFSTLATTSVEVQKRSVDVVSDAFVRAYEDLVRRSNNDVTQAETTTRMIVKGIERVAFRAGIEPSNIFMTGYCFFLVFVLVVTLCVTIFKLVLEGLAKGGRMKGDKFQEFRHGWLTVLKGILFRIVLIGFPQMTVLCFYELTRRDSAAEVVLAIFTLITMIGILGWASSKVIRIAKRSITLHKNPAYILYSDPASLNKWGFLYVQFKASAYYFIVPLLCYVFVKGLFVGVAQGSGTAQAIAFLLLEAALLIGVCIMRPYMDKKTNGINIAICAVNFLSAIFLVVFSKIFNQPPIVTGVMGVIFFIYNAAFALILLIMVLVSSIIAVTSKNPETRYQPMRDDRGSFIKSQTQLNTELDALGATARGEPKGAYKPRTGIDDDEESFSTASGGLRSKESGMGYPETAPRSPVEASAPLFPGAARSNASSPNPYAGAYAPPLRPGSGGSSSRGAFRQQNNSSPWQRGAGYDH